MEPIGTGAAANLTAEAAKGIFQVIKRHVKYVTSYEENVEKFEYTVETLKAKRTSVEQEVEVANNNGEAIKAEVELWHQRVDQKLEEEGKKVKDLEDKAKSNCFIGLCPNIKYRHEFSRKAIKVITAFDDLLRQSQFDGVSCPVVPEAIVEVSRKSYLAFDSRKMVFEQIMESLRDPTINIIGIYGTGGVGKTKLVEEAFRQANHDKLFVRMVALIAINRTPDIQKIQDAIAEFLGLKLEEKNTVARAHRLHPRLKKEKSILIVLDNIWAKLNVAEIRIPSGDEHKGCKILLTSRDKNVLSNQMDANATFEIGALEEKEAWELFTKIAENIVESDELRSLTTKVAERCAGLPISITTVAGALRNNSSPAVWKDALTTLENNDTRESISEELHCRRISRGLCCYQVELRSYKAQGSQTDILVLLSAGS